ncbi:hypothetical protein N5F23_00245 [Pseudomonas sichuanensis]|uniref:hypothetical protein n=1 Tax=Pseudomonas sichuanensis TaxID=2213015 RepID=UPI00244A697F|nr:hypothetical protein [Pseudomonas sichuanensis]MDH0731002.1 hypothetical protein [Pseudomonas sichuanensis]MDH1581021.1 hypothetical protein [Pseudomonas sichuanensis]MDH1591118.1 hypothetical protein [Pseudomonas sichuanensis]MDH1596787.1 hypothetical protein [Pseudomonas sichuanensis]
MAEVLAFLGKAFTNLFREIIFWLFFYWLGWPVVKMVSLGRHPKSDWRSETTERNWVSAVGIAVFAVGIALLAVGLGTSNAGLWIPGAALMVAGAVKRARS